MMVRKLYSAFAMLLLCAGAAAAEPLPVVSSFSILGDVASQIGGKRIQVKNLVGADADAHAYRLTAQDNQSIAKAKLVLLNGLGMEKADIIRAVKQSKVPYAEAAAGISPIKAAEHAHHHHHNHNHGTFDPHVWHDPVLMQQYAANVAAALTRADPAGKSHYQAGLQRYLVQLKQLDQYARQQFAAIPTAKRKVLTGHDSFAYLGKRYGVLFLSPQGVSTEAEPSARTVAAIIRQIKQQGLKAVFVENIKDGRMIMRIAQETGAKVSGKLYSDALSRGAPAATYADLFRHNVRTLANGMK